MKRASYRDGIFWLAVNDEPGEEDPEEIAAFITTILLADLFDVDPKKVAKDVLTYRKNHKS